jgi:hypothetical protein
MASQQAGADRRNVAFAAGQYQKQNNDNFVDHILDCTRSYGRAIASRAATARTVKPTDRANLPIAGRPVREGVPDGRQGRPA